MKLQRIVFDGTALNFTLPCRPWVPGTAGIGAGIEYSGSGIPSAWVTRRDRTLQITQRLTEGEWATFRDFLDWAQEGGVFSWYPDADDVTVYTCYLVSPDITEEVRPTRVEYPGDMEITFVIRTTNGAAIDEAFFS